EKQDWLQVFRNFFCHEPPRDFARFPASIRRQRVMSERDQRARAASEAAHADRIEGWIARLVAAPSPELLLAARAQHLERWAIRRDDFPSGRGGYLRWRSAVHERQGQRIGQILSEAGYEPALAARVSRLVAKAEPAGDPEAQA